jgi:outer membrane murein-binding lipoprotein Lpp
MLLKCVVVPHIINSGCAHNHPEGKKMTLEELQEKVNELAESNKSLVAKNKELLNEVKVFKDKARGVEIDPAEFQSIKTELEEARGQLAKVEKLSKTELDKLSNDIKKKDAALQKHLLDGGLTDALAKAGVKAEYMDATKALLRERAGINVDGDNYMAVFGDKPLLDGVKEWATSDAGKHFIAAPANSGGGANGSGGGKQKINRADFDKKSPIEKAQYVQNGGIVTE